MGRVMQWMARQTPRQGLYFTALCVFLSTGFMSLQSVLSPPQQLLLLLP